MHSILEKLAKSLRQKNYHNFMQYMIAFFAIRNLMIMKSFNISVSKINVFAPLTQSLSEVILNVKVVNISRSS